MNSKAIHIYDYKKIDLSKLMIPFEVNKEQLEQDIMLMRKKHAVLAEADEICMDDFVTISCESEIKRFRKDNVTFKVGKGIFSRELEEQIISMRVGEQKNLVVKEQPVHVVILKIERSTLPELNDENVASWGMEGIKTVEQYRNYLIEGQHQEDIKETVENVSSYVLELVVKNTEFEMDQKELDEQNAMIDKMVSEIQKMNAIDPESSEGKEHVEWSRAFLFQNYKVGLIGEALMKEKHVTITDKEYEDAVQAEMEYTELSKEETLQNFSREVFEKQYASSYFEGLVREYIYNFIMEKEY